MKRLIKGFVYQIHHEGREPYLSWSDNSLMAKISPAWVLVGPHDFTVECPDDFDPRPQQLKAIDEKERELRATFGNAITELAAQRAKILCIEMVTA